MPPPFAQDLNGRHLKNRAFFNDFAKGQQRRKKHEIQIVYNMDDAPFVLRYEQETIQKFITYTFSFYLTLSISLKKVDIGSD